MAVVLTIALGIGSNAAVHGFVRGLLTRDMPLPNSAAVVSVVGADANGAGPVSYDDYLSIKSYEDVFEWVGAARESRDTVVVDASEGALTFSKTTAVPAAA